MIHRRAFALSLLIGAATLAACSGGRPDGTIPNADNQPEMLFISPSGEPFRAKPPAPYPVEAWFTQADTNHDGKLDLAEFQADAERFFHVLDLNKDGVIDHREVYYYEHKIVPEILGQAYGALTGAGAGPRLWQASYFQLAQYGGGMGGGMGGMGGMGGPGGGAGGGPPVTDGSSSSKLPDREAPLGGAASYSLLNDPEPVQGSDIRLTGAITLSDFRIRAKQRFELLDYKHKGYLTLADLPETEVQKLMPHPRRGRGPARPV